MKTRLNVASFNGFTFLNGKLMDYKFISAKLNFENGEVEYTCKLGGKDEVFATNECPKVYANEDDFKANNSNIRFKEVEWKEVIRRVYDCYNVEEDREGIIHLYTTQNNEVERITAPMSNFTMYSNGKTEYNGTEKYYISREDAQLHCDVIIVDENGVESVSLSTAKRVALNDEQKRAVEEIRNAIEYAERLGVVLVVDNCSDRLYAYSATEIKKTEYDCGTRTYTEYGVRINDLFTPLNESIVSISTDDTAVYVEFE